MTKRPTKKAGRKPAAKKPAPRKQAAPEPIEMPAAKKRGRPSSYDPSMCERVIELGDEGKSKAQIARELGVSRQNLYRWMRVHPEFKEAMDEAEFAALAHWEDIGQAGLTMKGFNASLYAFQMKSRFREFYSDKLELEHTDSTDPEGRQLTDIDLARRIAFIFGEAMKSKRAQEQQQEQQPQGQEREPSGVADGKPSGVAYPIFRKH